MTTELPNLEKIENYLNGALPPEERASFDRALAQDTALREELDLVQDLLAGIELSGEAALKAQIGAAHDELKAEGFFEKKTAKIVQLQPARQWHWRRWAVAASVLIVGAAALWFWLEQESASQLFFEKNFAAEEVKIAAIIEDYDAPGLLAPDRERRRSLATALKSYRAKDYASARILLSSHFQNYPQDTIAQFYLGLSEMHLSHFEQAIAYLQPLSPPTLKPAVNETYNFQREATWYLALAWSQRPGQAAKDSTFLLLRRLEAAGDAAATNALRQLE